MNFVIGVEVEARIREQERAPILKAALLLV